MADSRLPLSEVKTTLFYDLSIADTNLYHAPRKFDVGNAAALVMGDNHGNTLKFIYTLMWQNVIANKNYDALFKNFKGFLKKNPDYTVLIGEFDKLTSEIEFTSKPHLFLLGDLFSDRVGNDVLNFGLFYTLHQRYGNYTIVNSNHDVEMQYFIETGKAKGSIIDAQKTSLVNMMKFFAAGDTKDGINVERLHIHQIYDTAYLPYVVPVTYTLSSELNDIVILSHAAVNIPKIGLMYINAYAITSYLDGNCLTPAFCADTPLELAKSIDRLNDRYKQHAAKKGLHSWYPAEAFTCNENNLTEWNWKLFPFYCGIWNRTNIERNPHPFKNPAQRAIYVHGHDRKGIKDTHIIELDNSCGKDMDSYPEALPVFRVNGVINARSIFIPTTDAERKAQWDEIINHQKLYDETIAAITKLSNPLSAKILGDIKKLTLATNDEQYEKNKLLSSAFIELHKQASIGLAVTAKSTIERYFLAGGDEFELDGDKINMNYLSNEKISSSRLCQIALKISDMEENPQASNNFRL